MSSHGKATTYFTRGLAAFGAGAFALHAWRLGLTLLGTPRGCRIDRKRLRQIDSSDFRDYVSTITEAHVHADTRVTVLKNGDVFYPAEFEAIRTAKKSVNLEGYGFLEGKVTREFLAILSELAARGVEVRMVIDAIGSWKTHSSYFDELRMAGGRVAWYHPIDSRTWPYLNNRTHRKLLVIDGKVGFIGGAGFADHWVDRNAQGRPWRDTMLRLEGGAVAGLNAVFAENWLETTGEILAGDEHFRFTEVPDGRSAMIVTSTPRGGTTRARILYQTLIEAAAKTIHITTPYFVPDRSARRALLRAVTERGVQVKILTAGPHSDHPMTRRLSRMFDVKLARAGPRSTSINLA